VFSYFRVLVIFPVELLWATTSTRFPRISSRRLSPFTGRLGLAFWTRDEIHHESAKVRKHEHGHDRVAASFMWRSYRRVETARSAVQSSDADCVPKRTYHWRVRTRTAAIAAGASRKPALDVGRSLRCGRSDLRRAGLCTGCVLAASRCLYIAP
jgi:hypothetical protein